MYIVDFATFFGVGEQRYFGFSFVFYNRNDTT